MILVNYLNLFALGNMSDTKKMLTDFLNLKSVDKKKTKTKFPPLEFIFYVSAGKCLAISHGSSSKLCVLIQF